MSTITRERLEPVIERLEHYATNVKWTNVQAAQDMLIAVDAMRITLASLEAKPIGAFHIADQQVDGTSDYIKDGEWPIDDGVIEVYAAPPVPVSVPDFKKLARELVENLVDCDGADDSAVKQYLKWTEKTCHDAMLQGAEPVTTAYKLPANVIGALEKALQAMSFMGDTLNEMDAVCEEDVEYVTPAFEAVRKVLDGGSPVVPDGLCPSCGRKQLKSRTCSVAGCEGKHVAHGFCKKHYDIERKKDPSRRESIRAADERYRARKSAASQQEVK
ncbi:hypothetical protein [Enterobacter cloacae]|uniref:hypothetical protein n=1 Tax=Enterobacter cloacae TaxID=550 RepID=UPI0034A443C3